MIRTGLLAAAFAALAGAGAAQAAATDGWRQAGSMMQPLTEPREFADNDIVRPPQPDIDPGMAVTPPGHNGKMREALPPGSPERGVDPR